MFQPKLLSWTISSGSRSHWIDSLGMLKKKRFSSKYSSKTRSIEIEIVNSFYWGVLMEMSATAVLVCRMKFNLRSYLDRVSHAWANFRGIQPAGSPIENPNSHRELGADAEWRHWRERWRHHRRREYFVSWRQCHSIHQSRKSKNGHFSHLDTSPWLPGGRKGKTFYV